MKISYENKKCEISKKSYIKIYNIKKYLLSIHAKKNFQFLQYSIMNKRYKFENISKYSIIIYQKFIIRIDIFFLFLNILKYFTRF